MSDEEAQISAEVVRALEGILLVAMEPVDPTLLAQLLEQPLAVVEGLCERLSMAYAEAGHGFQLVKVAGGYRFQSHPDVSAYVERFVLDSQQARISSAALETLAIIAYKQPITKSEIEEIRGVSCDYTVQKLMEKDLVAVAGRADGPGKPLLYKTSTTFMDHFGINSTKDLPKLKEIETQQENAIGETSIEIAEQAN